MLFIKLKDDDLKFYTQLSKDYNEYLKSKKFSSERLDAEGDKNGSFVGVAFKLGTELVSAVLVGTIIGFILDSWFGTKPWLIIIFFFLGAVAGMLNVIRTANRMQKED